MNSIEKVIRNNIKGLKDEKDLERMFKEMVEF